MVYDIMKIERKRINDLMNELMNESINDEAVYRTAPGTPGLLIKRNNKIILKTLYSTFYFLNIKIISMTTFFI